MIKKIEETIFIFILLQDDANLPPPRYSDIEGPITESSIAAAAVASASNGDEDELETEI